MRESEIHGRSVDALYVDAMLLADEARSYYEGEGRDERDMLAPDDRIAFSCESLRVTTRLMHVIAWLLTRRAVEAGELDATTATDRSHRLGAVASGMATPLADLPGRAAALVAASVALHRRAAVLDAAFAGQAPTSPARSMLQRLAAAI